ncbi:MAG: methyltransferase domain-containing protein [Kofleriaceae bacterium]
MSKRDDDSGTHSTSDMEAGMTTAERRRRRRRGGGLRVPSDNVPRRTTPPVVAPVPEDPSLAMSIAYSFTSDGSESVPRIDDIEDHSRPTSMPSFADPVAPDSMSTVIDPPSVPVESADFEMKTREMSAVDLEALGLTDPTDSPKEPRRVSSPGLPMVVQNTTLTNEPQVTFRPSRSTTEPSAPMAVDVDVDMTDTPSTNGRTGQVHSAKTGPVVRQQGTSEPPPFKRPPRAATEPPVPPVEPPRAAPRERLRTVALSEEDLEEVREAVRAASQPAEPAPPPPPGPKFFPNTTQPLSPLDIEQIDRPASIGASGGSVPEIDLNDLMQRTADSGEFEVDVETPPPPAPLLSSTADTTGPIARQRQVSAPPPVTTKPPDPDRARHVSAPPPLTTKTPDPDRAHAPPPPPQVAKDKDKDKDHHPPPLPPQAAKDHHVKPPTPPKKSPPAASAASKIEGKGARGKPWFVDLFDEDYLRTLPFLTPQATQSEAEFVIDAMGLSPGAQVLDVGCGYGRHAMELAARGFHVVGLDLSTPLLVRGGEEAQRRGLEINFVRGDMRELDFDAQFDGAYCLFSTFGYFDDETNKKTVSNIARALKPGGRVMIEILNRDYVIADLPTRVWWEGEGCVVLEEVELNYFSSRIQVNRSVVFDDGRQLEQEISVRAYSLHEVGKLMHAAGFRVLEVSGGYHTRGRFFGNQSRHIIVLAERKDPSAA